jgi:valyl-tRNA synthetase
MTVLAPASQWIYKQYLDLEKELKLQLQQYTLGHSIDALYKYLWDNFADWYLEYLKTDDTQKEFARELLKQYIILLHPYMPYETEVLWREFAGESGLLAKQLKDFEFITKYKINSQDVAEFEAVKNLIESLRSMRGLFAIDPATKLTVHTSSPTVLRYSKYFELLGKANVVEGKTLSFTVGTGELQVSIDIQHYLPDVKAEVTRTNKLIDNLQKQINGLNAKLQNKKFLANADQESIDEARQNLDLRNNELMEQQRKLEIIDNM